MSDSQVGYDRIMNNLIPYPLHLLLRPVHFSEDKVGFTGSGTLILAQNGQHRGIITAAHLFAKGKNRHTCFYQILQPHSNTFYPIAKVQEATGDDVAKCVPGPTGSIACDLEDKTMCNQEGTFEGAVYDDATLLTTGEKVPVLGKVTNPSGEKYYVLDYQSYPGESGSGLLGSQGGLYVLKGNCKVTDTLRENLRFTPKIEYVAFAASVTWQ